MANPEHLEILKQGVEVWNEWRSGHSDILPDLRDADLHGTTLHKVDLRGADLWGANLSGSDLTSAHLLGADISNANLVEANLAIANFMDARLVGVNLSRANLSPSILLRAFIRSAVLSRTNLNRAVLGLTTFANVDLSDVEGLEGVKHLAGSEISISTIYLSKGNIPEIFMRGCGVPEDFITYAQSLTTRAIEFYSCFISYSSKDQDFAERLHADLQAKGVRVWFAPHDLPIGARIRPAIDESIRLHDKLLLVLSESSVSSQWVEQEVETALAREREPEGRTVLFPVRIDGAVMDIKTGWPALLKNTRNVGDFTRWEEHGPYQKAFERLLRDLKAGA